MRGIGELPWAMTSDEAFSAAAFVMSTLTPGLDSPYRQEEMSEQGQHQRSTLERVPYQKMSLVCVCIFNECLNEILGFTTTSPSKNSISFVDSIENIIQFLYSAKIFAVSRIYSDCLLHPKFLFR